MPNPPEVLTTGQVAKICNVAPRTVSKWFDSGQLRGYRIPGSKDRRIPMDQLLRFMKAHGIPLNGLDGGTIRVLVVDPDESYAALLKNNLEARNRFDVVVARSVFAAGILADKHRPQVILLDVSTLPSDWHDICRCLQASDELENTKLIAIGVNLNDGLKHQLTQEGFEACVRKPFQTGDIIQAIDDALSIVN